MAKCPHCKQTVTLDKTHREVANASDEIHKDVVGLMKKEIMYSCPIATACSDSAFSSAERSPDGRSFLEGQDIKLPVLTFGVSVAQLRVTAL